MENILEKLLRLTQLASNPKLIDSGYKEEPAKFIELDTVVKDIISKGEKLIIWTSFVENIREIRRRYASNNPLMIFGEISTEQMYEVCRTIST